MTQYTLGLTRLIGAGRAFTEVLSVPNPAANSGFTYTNTGKYWELVDLVAFELVSDSNATNRQITLQILDGQGIPLATLPSASVQTASLTWQYTWSVDFSNFNTVVALAVTSPLPYVFLQPDYAIVVSLASGHSGDVIKNIRLSAGRFQTGSSGYLRGTVDIADPAFDEALTLDQIRR